jgi:hypothetical protein
MSTPRRRPGPYGTGRSPKERRIMQSRRGKWNRIFDNLARFFQHLRHGPPKPVRYEEGPWACMASCPDLGVASATFGVAAATFGVTAPLSIAFLPFAPPNCPVYATFSPVLAPVSYHPFCHFPRENRISCRILPRLLRVGLVGDGTRRGPAGGLDRILQMDGTGSARRALGTR